MSRENSRKRARLESFPKDSIETAYEEIKGLLSFNFKYLDPNQGERFSDLKAQQLSKIIDKLKWYSNNTRQHWEQETDGKSSILAVYDSFPRNSDFHHPRHVPVDVSWARFRMEGDQRLVGFFVKSNGTGGHALNTNIFYVVFLDCYHRFYKCKR